MTASSSGGTRKRSTASGPAALSATFSAHQDHHRPSTAHYIDPNKPQPSDQPPRGLKAVLQRLRSGGGGGGGGGGGRDEQKLLRTNSAPLPLTERNLTEFFDPEEYLHEHEAFVRSSAERWAKREERQRGRVTRWLDRLP